MKIVNPLLTRRVAKAMKPDGPATFARRNSRPAPDAPRKRHGALRRAEKVAVLSALQNTEGD